MAKCDYRLCDLCNSKVFYDAEVDYDAYEEQLGDWAVICSDCARDHRVMIVKKGDPEEQAAEITALREKLALVVEYAASSDCRIRAMRQPDETRRWKVTNHYGQVLNKYGAWESDILPSYRDDDYYERCRFDTAEEARQVLEGLALEKQP